MRRLRSTSKRKWTKMKGLLVLLVGCAVAEPPAPYAPSGWRPAGPAFELPQRGQNPNYLPPLDPRVPALAPDAEQDVSVQGLPPRQEQQPLFQVSPISGQQYVGPAFNRDIKDLDQGLQQAQFQVQQQKAREFARQRQENDANRQPTNRQASTNVPRQFVPRPTVYPTESSYTRPNFNTTPNPSTTEPELNEGETDVIPPAVAEKQKVSVEVTRQNIQEYPPELFLNPLAQLRLQPVQFGQLKSPFISGQEASQKQVSGFDAEAHFAALPSVLAQQQLAQQQALMQGQFPQNQAYVVRGQTSGASFLIQSPQQLQTIVSGQYDIQPLAQLQGQNVVMQPQSVNQIQPNAFAQPQQPEQNDESDDSESDRQPQNGVNPQVYQPQFQGAYQPQPQLIYQAQTQAAYQPQAEGVFQQQPVFQQQQPLAFQPQPQNVYQSQTEGVYQPQPVFQQQPQVAYQPQAQAEGVFPQAQAFQPQSSYQPQLYQPQADQPQLVYQQFPQAPEQQNFFQGQLVNLPGQNLELYYQQQFESQKQRQGQDALQSGLNVNQQGNSVDDEQKDDNEDANEDGATATAVATAFGTRTQPRVNTVYGAPAQRPQATTEPAQDVTTEDGPVIAEATAVAGGRRKSAKLRNRRIRPVFTLDRSGHLVLAQDQ